MRMLWIPVALTLLLSACGYKGPLYLPERTTTIVTPTSLS